jgi:hypothetical protein
VATRRAAIPSTWRPESETPNEPELLSTHLMEGIGIALDLEGRRIFVTDYGGSVYSANLDGSNKKLLLVRRKLTGIIYAECP